MALGRGNIEIDVGARGFEDDIVSQVNSAQRRIQPLNLISRRSREKTSRCQCNLKFKQYPVGNFF